LKKFLLTAFYFLLYYYQHDTQMGIE